MKYSAAKFSQVYTTLCEAQGLSPRRALKELFGMDGSNLQKWRNEESTPKADIYLAVAEYFNVPMDYLYGRALPERADSIATLTLEEKQLVSKLRRAEASQAKLAMKVVAVMLGEEAK